jgi:hypothetical protein
MPLRSKDDTTDLEIFDESPEEGNKVLCSPNVSGHGLLEQIVGKG